MQRLVAAILALLVGFAGSSLWADDAGIVVHGTGEAKLRPTRVEIRIPASASAELTEDALVKYRDLKKRTFEAFDALKMKNLKVEERRLTLSNSLTTEALQAVMNGNPATSDKQTEIQISSIFLLQLDGIETLEPEQLLKTVGKLLDVIQDTGLGLGPSMADISQSYRYGRSPSGTEVKFVLRDWDKVRDQVYEKAVADARDRAQRLARLNNVQLGPVVHVQEISITGDDAQQQVVAYGGVVDDVDAEDGPQLTTASLADVVCRVKIQVRFAIQSAPAKPAR